MDICTDVSVSGGLPSEPVVPPVGSKLGSCSGLLEELFPGENTESDHSLEWLSIFVEDCFSNSNHIPQTIIPTPSHHQKTASKPLETHLKPSFQKLVIPARARTKRRRTTYESTTTHLRSWSHVQQDHGQTLHDHPLLHQTHWLADSELIVVKKDPTPQENVEGEEEEEDKEGEKTRKGSLGSLEGSLGQARRCTHCLSRRTPQWRAGPLGPKTLCNACGVRFKSGRLLPEYRPAKSPTFVSYKHSNSHKKVMEMRMAIGFSTISTE